VPEINYSNAVKKPGAFPPVPLPPVMLLVGTDDGLKREALNATLQAALDPDFADFDHEEIDLSLGSASEDMSDAVGKILQAAGAAPFSSPKRVVTVASVQKLTKERQDLLASLLPRISEFSLVILIADAQEMEAGRPKGKQIELALRKAVSKIGAVVVCDSPEGADLRSRAAAMLLRAGKKPGTGVIDALMVASSPAGIGHGDINALTHETNKLVTYVGDREQITKEDTLAVLPGATDENIFRLLDAIGARATAAALSELDSLILAEGRPDATGARLLVMIQRHFRLMSLAKYLADKRLLGKNALPEEVKDMLPGEMVGFASTQTYRLTAYARQASNFRWDEIYASIGRIMATDLTMKGIVAGKNTMPKIVDFADDPAASLRMLIFDLCRRSK
jgi:DNA polymerase-3 subunit delta